MLHQPIWSLKLEARGKTGILKIPHFLDQSSENKKFKKEIKKMFRKIKRTDLQKLVIDVSDNPGGLMGNTAYLYSFLAEAPFKICTRIETAFEDDPTFQQFTNFQKVFGKQGIQLFPKLSSAYPLKDHVGLKVFHPQKNAFQGEVVVVTNHLTNSAACVFSMLVKREGRGKIIGTETRSNYANFTADQPVRLVLPHSKIEVAIPSRSLHFLEHPSNGQSIMPDIEMNADVFSAKDREAVLLNSLY
jgi:C-terminal processing protease CtpA/Prc